LKCHLNLWSEIQQLKGEIYEYNLENF